MQLTFHESGDVHHRHLRELLDAALDDALGKFAQVEEGVRSGIVLPLQGQVEVEDGDVRSTGFHHLGAFRVLGEVVHGGVYLLVHFDEGEVGVRAVVEAQADQAGAVARLAVHVLQAGDLDKLLTQGADDGVLQLAGGGVRGGDLHRDFRYGDVRQQGDGQGEVRHQPDNEAGGEGHQYGNGALYKEFDHSFLLFDHDKFTL